MVAGVAVADLVAEVTTATARLTLDALLEILADRVGHDVTGVTAETALVDLALDSLDLLELAMALESASGASLPDAQLRTCTTVGDVLRSINEGGPSHE